MYFNALYIILYMMYFFALYIVYDTFHDYLIYIICSSITIGLGMRKPGPEFIKLFMLNSSEHEIYPAQKC